MGSVQKNAKSADALQDKILAGNMAAELTAKAAIDKVVGGALIGADVSISMTSLINFIAYKKGEISKEKLIFYVP